MSDDHDDSSEPLHMIQIRLSMPGLTEIGKMHGLPLDRVDDNYLVHCALGKLFQDKSPKPFDLGKKDGRHIQVLGYADCGAEELETTARAFAEPSVVDRVCDWDTFASKRMPESFPEGMEMQFELRACPVVRKASDGPRWSEGQELDAFLSEAFKPENEDVELDRGEIYRDWLVRQFDIRGGAGVDADSVRMKRFSIERMTRRTHGEDRKVRTIQRPDVTLTGRLSVTDPPKFMEILASGVGRHKSFGYGMLKLKPA